MERIYACGSVLMMLIFQGCATITTGTDQTVTVETDPPGAVCTLQRDGVTIGAVNPTPGSVEIDKDKDEVNITCERAEYLTTTEVMDSNFHGATLGNLILGGVVGVVIDAGSGAMNEYPTAVKIRMQPAVFNSLRERDMYFDSIVQEIRTRSETLASSREYNCTTTPCKRNMEKLNEKTEAELAEVEANRATADYRDGSMTYQSPVPGS